jgi:hypothetical protein
LSQENDEIRQNLAELSRRSDAVADRNTWFDDRLRVLSRDDEIMTQRIDELHEKYLQVQTDARIMRDNLAETRDNLITDSSRQIANLTEELDVLKDRVELDTPLRRLDYYIECLENQKEVKIISLKNFVVDFTGSGVMSRGSNYTQLFGEIGVKIERLLDLIQTNQTIETFHISYINFGNSESIQKLLNFVLQSRKLKNILIHGICLPINSFIMPLLERNQTLINICLPAIDSSGMCPDKFPRTILNIVKNNTTIKYLDINFPVINDLQNGCSWINSECSDYYLLSKEYYQLCKRKGIISKGYY